MSLIPKKNSLTFASGSAAASPVPATATPPQDHGGSGLPSRLDALKEKRRGVKPGTKRGSYDKGNRGGLQTERPGPGGPAAEAAPLFTPENAKLIVRMPFNMAVAKTGWTGWELDPAEAEILAAPLAVTLNTWVKIDPKWVSLSLFSMALLSITGEKMLLYRGAVAERDKVPTPAPKPAAPAAPTEVVQP